MCTTGARLNVPDYLLDIQITFRFCFCFFPVGVTFRPSIYSINLEQHSFGKAPPPIQSFCSIDYGVFAPFAVSHFWLANLVTSPSSPPQACYWLTPPELLTDTKPLPMIWDSLICSNKKAGVKPPPHSAGALPRPGFPGCNGFAMKHLDVFPRWCSVCIWALACS